MSEKTTNDRLVRRLVEARKNIRWTQADLAKATGLQPAAISHFERGQRLPSLPNVVKLADALRVSLDWLTGRNDGVPNQRPFVEIDGVVWRLEEQLKKAKLETTQPALVSCPKCGSKDIARQHREPGNQWKTYATIPKGNTHESEWISEDHWEGNCKKECIASVCRCCGFRWECDPLPDDSNAVKWQAKTILEPVYDDDGKTHESPPLELTLTEYNALKKLK